MNLADQIAALAARFTGQRQDRIDPANLFGRGRIEGDDADEFWDAFCATFTVDLSALRPYLHYDNNEPPGWWFRSAWGVRADGRRIPDIPIALADLVAAVEAGRWSMTYPEHRLVERYPLFFLAPTFAIALIVALFLVWSFA